MSKILFTRLKLSILEINLTSEAATRGVLYEMFLKILQNSLENTCARVSFLIKLQACNFIKKETLAQVFSYEFCEIFETNFFTEHLWVNFLRSANTKGLMINKKLILYSMEV